VGAALAALFAAKAIKAYSVSKWKKEQSLATLKHRGSILDERFPVDTLYFSALSGWYAF
jgi:hypothetical protein